MGSPFEPLATVPSRFLTLKSIFLVAITSARQVSELCSLSTNPNLCLFQEDRVILQLDPSFMPKVNSVFHQPQEVVLPTLCLNPLSSKERVWHSLDVKRALSFYLDRMKEFRKSDAIFILFEGPSRGKKASKGSLSQWLRASILEAYKALGRDPPSQHIPPEAQPHQLFSRAAFLLKLFAEQRPGPLPIPSFGTIRSIRS